MPKIVRFHAARYSNEYGFFEANSVYTDIPDDFKLSSSEEEITREEITAQDNVRTKPYDALTTSGITKKVVNQKAPRSPQTKHSLDRRPPATANKPKQKAV